MKREPVFLIISNYYIYIYIYINPFAPIKKHPYFFAPYSLSFSLCVLCVCGFSSSFFFFSGKGIRKKGRKKNIFFLGDNPKRKERKFRVPLCCEVREWERERKQRKNDCTFIFKAVFASDHYHYFSLFFFFLFFIRLSFQIPENPSHCKPQFQSPLSLFPFIFFIPSFSTHMYSKTQTISLHTNGI